MKSANKIDEIVALLSSVPITQDEAARKVLVRDSKLPSVDLAWIDYSGSALKFSENLITGILDNSKDPTRAVSSLLSCAADSVGVDRKQEIQRLIADWRYARRAFEVSGNLGDTYFNWLINNWNDRNSPLLPADCRLSKVATELEVSDTRKTIGNQGELIDDDFQSSSRHLVSSVVDFYKLLLDANAPKKMVLVGDPGTGKTTLLYQIAARIAQSSVFGDDALLPVLISLSEFAKEYARGTCTDLRQFVEAQVTRAGLPSIESALKVAINEGRFLLLADGLDEVAESEREAVVGLIESALNESKGNIGVVTSRRVGFRGCSGFRLLEIVPLSLQKQRHLLIRICGEAKAKAILMEIGARSELRELCTVPMMLTVIALVARQSEGVDADFFRRYSKLFQQAIELLLEGRHRGGRGVVDSYAAEAAMATLSFDLHRIAETSEVYSRQQLEHELASIDHNVLRAWNSPRHFVRDVSENSGIIFPIDTALSNYRYIHRTFREYLAANHISKMPPEERFEFVKTILGDSTWSEVLVIMAGLVSDEKNYFRQLLFGPPDLALRAMREAPQLDASLAREVLGLRPATLKARRDVFLLLRSKISDNETIIDALLAYAESVGDQIPRIDVFFIISIFRSIGSTLALNSLERILVLLPELSVSEFQREAEVIGLPNYWCSVPGGEFLAGGDENDPERPPWVPITSKVHISSFNIGRVPVTNRLYEQFDPMHVGRRAFTDQVAESELEFHPVVNVSWFEAAAFCYWASRFEKGLRLPTEWEWEKAASWTGNRKLRYPWGDFWDPRRLNCWESGPNRTTQVGSYPEGKSPTGALDMAGNVWEWCLDWFSDAQSGELTGRDPAGSTSGERRVDRGGGWYHDVGRPCTYIRAADDPSDVFSHCGFRLVRSEVPIDYFENAINDDKI